MVGESVRETVDNYTEKQQKWAQLFPFFRRDIKTNELQSVL